MIISAHEKLPWHVNVMIGDYVNQLHITEQRHNFATVLEMVKCAGVSPNEDMPELLDITTGLIIIEPRGWSKRVSEALSNIAKTPHHKFS